MTTSNYLGFQSLMMGNALVSSTAANGASALSPTASSASMTLSGATAVVEWDDAPTNPNIAVSDLPGERTIVESRALPYDVAHEMLAYDSFRITSGELARFERWLSEKHIRVGFFTKGIELLVQMRREERRFEEEITQVMPAAARRRI